MALSVVWCEKAKYFALGMQPGHVLTAPAPLFSIFIGEYDNFTGKKGAVLYETMIFSIRIPQATVDTRLGW